MSDDPSANPPWEPTSSSSDGPLRGDPVRAAEFLRSWLPEGPWTVVHDWESAGAPRRAWGVGQYYPGDEDALVSFIARHDGRDNLYFLVNLPAGNLRTSPSEEEMVAYLGVPLDVDLPSTSTDADRSALVDRVREVSPPATVITISGGGVQAFWRFAARVPLDRVDEVERMTLSLADALGGDHVQNVNRLMRLPFTVNVLNAKKRAAGRTPALSYVVEADFARTFSLDAPLDLPPPPPQPGDFTLESLPAPWAERARSTDAGWLTGTDRSRSALVFAFARQLVRFGWPDEPIVDLLTDPSLPIAAHVLDQGDPRTYALRQARRAREYVAKEFRRDPKTGRVLQDAIDNVRRGFTALQTTLSYDAFADQLLYVNGDARPNVVDDAVLIDYRFKFEEQLHFRPNKDLFTDATARIARERTFDPVVGYLAGLGHDRTPRIDTWLIDYAGAPDNPYVRAVGRLFLVAAVTRAREPGVKFDEMLVFESPEQGTEKSSALELLAVRPEWFSDSLNLASADREVIEQLSGKWIVEASDLSGMRRSEVESLKAFLSRTTDRARLAYGRLRTDRKRRCVFAGTTNSTRYLRDERNRRFWPIRIRKFDLAGLARVRDQLWAEAARAHATGESIRLDPALWPFAAAEQAARAVADPWLDLIEDALVPAAEAPDAPLTGRIAVRDVFTIVGRNDGLLTQEDQRRVGEIMRALGWERHRTGNRWWYERGDDAERRRVLIVNRDPVPGGRVEVVPWDDPRLRSTLDPDRPGAPTDEGGLPF